MKKQHDTRKFVPTPPMPPPAKVTVTKTGSLCVKTNVKAGLGFSGIFFGGYYYG